MSKERAGLRAYIQNCKDALSCQEAREKIDRLGRRMESIHAEIRQRNILEEMNHFQEFWEGRCANYFSRFCTTRIMLRRDDPEFQAKFDRCFHWASYLAKENQKGHKAKRQREVFASRIPKQPALGG